MSKIEAEPIYRNRATLPVLEQNRTMLERFAADILTMKVNLDLNDDATDRWFSAATPAVDLEARGLELPNSIQAAVDHTQGTLSDLEEAAEMATDNLSQLLAGLRAARDAEPDDDLSPGLN